MPPRRRKPRPEAGRCQFKEGNRRCARTPGAGGMFCATHLLVMEDAAQQRPGAGGAVGDLLRDVLAGKKIDPRKAAAAGAEVFTAFFSGGAARARPSDGGFSPFSPFTPFEGFSNPPIPGQQRSAPRPPPPPQFDEDDVKRLRARKLIGFGAREVLTVEIIRKRQRDLGKRFHPDLQPADKREEAGRKMAAISGACALLMADLKASRSS